MFVLLAVQASLNSDVVEHSLWDVEVPGSNPIGVEYLIFHLAREEFFLPNWGEIFSIGCN